MSKTTRTSAPWIIAVLALYGAALATRVALGGGWDEPLAILVLFGLLFPGLALLLSRGCAPPLPPGPPLHREAWVLAMILVYVCLILALKGRLESWLLPTDAGPRLRELVNLLLKLLGLAAVPLCIYRWRMGVWPRVPARRATVGRLCWIGLILGGCVFTVSLMLSSDAATDWTAQRSPLRMVFGSVLCFVWMALEAGLVEELLFRYLLQSRLAALLRSPAAAVALGCLLFGLAHVPGMWLRGAGVTEGLGSQPGLLTVLAYALTTQSVAGLMPAVVWARTGSLMLAVVLHALIDTAANAPEFMRTWGI